MYPIHLVKLVVIQSTHCCVRTKIGCLSLGLSYAVLEDNTMHSDSDKQQTSSSSPSSLPAPSTMPVSLLVQTFV